MQLKAFTLFSILTSVIAAPGGAYIRNVELNGSGCPTGTGSTSTWGGDGLSVDFSSFRAETGSNTRPLDQRANCQATIEVKAPSGYQFSPARVIVKGSVKAGGSVTAERTSYYYFQGKVDQSTVTSSRKSSGRVDNTDWFDESGGWSACGATSIVNINVAVAVDNGSSGASGSSVVDSVDYSEFRWRRC